MKKFLVVLCVAVLVAGCAESFRKYVEEPNTIFRDPHYAQYQEKLRALEHEYLVDEIDYATYLERKNDLDEQYAKEVQEREAVISGN